jgi:hypothetical protein
MEPFPPKHPRLEPQLRSEVGHKSGVVLRFPRIARIRTDKPDAEADRLESLMRLVENGAERAAVEASVDPVV